MDKILIVDDEVKILRILELQLNHEGYETDTARNGMEAVQKVTHGGYDLILMDVMMPVMDGMEACRAIKASHPETKIIMLTARDDTKDIIAGLDSGADDYVAKPFVFEELLARIRANIRKSEQGPENKILTFEDLTINHRTFEVTRAGQPIELSKTEYNLLSYLVANKEIVLSREQILERVWGYAYYGNPNVVDVFIKYVRDKVDKGFERKLIQTVRGRGYVVR
ncbi:MAG: response regulator transcription factor [Bacillota bacterium]|nr:response regulator transcription factor [Bacillota bacterium]